MPDNNKNIDDSKFLDPTQILIDLNIEERMQVADFGAGSGYMTFQVSRMVGPKGYVYALDVKKSVIEHLNAEIKRRDLTNVSAIWTDIEMLGRNPITNARVDLVLIVNMLFQSTKHYDVLKEAYRIMKPGGRLVVIDWKKQAAPFGPPPDDRIDLDKFKEMAYTLGLNKVKEFEAGPYHFGVVFKK